MHRILAAFVLLLAAAFPAAADNDWHAYANPRFGYILDIPPGFEPLGEADDGDGLVFHANDNGATLTVFGSELAAGDFEIDVNDRMASEREDQWRISYSRVTAAWASFSGVRDEEVFYTRAIALCDGSAAYFRLQYRKSRLTSFDGVISRMAEALRPSEGCQQTPVAAAPAMAPN